MARRIVCRCRSRPSSPIHAMSAAYSRSSPRSKQPPPSARHVRPHGPEPSAPHGSALQVRICSSSCLSWLHLLKSWSLRQSRGGSIYLIPVSPPEQRARVLMMRADAHARKGDDGLAIQDLDEAIHLRPKDPGALNNRCYQLAKMGRLELALADCNESLNLRPNDRETLDSRG